MPGRLCELAHLPVEGRVDRLCAGVFRAVGYRAVHIHKLTVRLQGDEVGLLAREFLDALGGECGQFERSHVLGGDE
jgi:hypothetical protein